MRTTSEASARGTTVHRFLERLPEVGREPALAEVQQEHRAQCAAIDPARVPQGDREVAYALDVDTGRVVRLPAAGHRAYVAPGPGRWVFGTADVVQPSPVVLDYKVTDVPHDERGLLKPAGQSHQLRFLGLCAARVAGTDSVEVGHIRVRSDGYLDDSDRATLGYFDLVQIEREVRGIVDRVEAAARAGRPDVHPGNHCALCPAAAACPSTRALVEQVAEAGLLERALSDPAAGWIFLRRARAALDLLDEELRREAALRPIRLPDGREVRAVEEEREELDPRVVWLALNYAYPERAWEAMSASKAGVQRLTGGGAALRSTMSAIRSRGGARKATLRVVREVEPAAPAAPALAWGDNPLDFEILHRGVVPQDQEDEFDATLRAAEPDEGTI